MSQSSTRFRSIGATHHLVVTEPSTLTAATAIALNHLTELDLAASRFRHDSEVSGLARGAAAGPVTAAVSPLLMTYLQAALRAAVLTEGLVDPTVGRSVCAAGYDSDLAAVLARPSTGETTVTTSTDNVPGWRSVGLDRLRAQVSLSQGTLLDLGASAKAYAADTIAGLLSRELSGGFLVNLGGDIATAGDAPAQGWQIAVAAPDGGIAQVVTGTGQGFATSSTRHRRWRVGTEERHHIVDPRTGRTAVTPWAQVTCAGANALEANAASTAALVLADAAPAWLEARGIPARLQSLHGSVVTTCGWPSSEGDPRAEAAA